MRRETPQLIPLLSEVVGTCFRKVVLGEQEGNLWSLNRAKHALLHVDNFLTAISVLGSPYNLALLFIWYVYFKRSISAWTKTRSVEFGAGRTECHSVFHKIVLELKKETRSEHYQPPLTNNHVVKDAANRR